MTHTIPKTMNLPKKIVDKFNANTPSSFNDNSNIAKGLPTLEQYHFMLGVYNRLYGMSGNGRLKMSDIKAHNEIYNEAQTCNK